MYSLLIFTMALIIISKRILIISIRPQTPLFQDSTASEEKDEAGMEGVCVLEPEAFVSLTQYSLCLYSV